MSDWGNVSIDVDSLSSIYKGQGCSNAGGYTYLEYRMGLENLLEFFSKYQIRTTMFMVGNDFLYKENHSSIRDIANNGHEIANHSMTHPQGFRWLSQNEKEKELSSMSDICHEVTGKRPIGFRSPGWNIDDSTLPILEKLNYKYDSSVFPTSLMPIMKFAHWSSMSKQKKQDRTTMGQFSYMFSPIKPYYVSDRSLGKSGNKNLIEFPISVSPYLRIPFFATLLLFSGVKFYKKLYRSLRSAGLPIHFQMHLSDFIDYSIPELVDQMPRSKQGTYVPQSLNTPLSKKIELFSEMIEMIGRDYEFITLDQWTEKFRGTN
ncbi:MAG: polysaccharide deacetylase family protein [Pelolinea sp.]|nr:polysaccharide deacetylase family protein [Pelolinea sp.]